MKRLAIDTALALFCAALSCGLGYKMCAVWADRPPAREVAP